MPRVALGRALADVAHACIDVSDGLLADLGHVCRASGVGARIELERLPASDALRAAFVDAARHVLQATGGDDYELCFTAAADLRDGIEQIGREAGTPVARSPKESSLPIFWRGGISPIEMSSWTSLSVMASRRRRHTRFSMTQVSAGAPEMRPSRRRGPV